MTFLEQGENGQALKKFEDLLIKYNELNDSKNSAIKQNGIWWTRHNQGIAYSRNQNFEEAIISFNEGLNILGEPSIDESAISQSDSANRNYQRNNETYISVATTLRRLGQLFAEQARIESDDKEASDILKQLAVISMTDYLRF